MKRKPDNAPRSKLLGYTSQEPIAGKLADRFKTLVQQCEREAGSLHVAQLASHRAFRELMSLGDDIVPLLLEGLDLDEPKDWFAALQKITGVDPVSPANKGNPKGMACDWLRWARARGILPAQPPLTAESVASGTVAVGAGDGVVLLQASGDGGPAQLTPREAERHAARLVNAARQARQQLT